MEKILVDYVFNTAQISNPDGSIPLQVTGCTQAAGPGETIAGNFPKSLSMGASGRLKASMGNAPVNSKQFCIRIVFKADGSVMGRQNLVESTQLPFSMFIDKKGSGGSAFQLQVSCAPAAHGWGGTNTEFFMTLNSGTWYVADLVYDMDTLGLFIDGSIVSVHAFPQGVININAGNQDFFLGTWVDGNRNRFNGDIAAFQWFSGIPLALETQLDERRSHAEWFISYKNNSIKKTLNLGAPAKKYYYASSSSGYIQEYQAGMIMYSPAIGTAFEMHGSIWNYFKSFTRKSELGYLISDEINAGAAGARKSLFQKGGIYWSGGTGARAVTGQMYLDYEGHGEFKWIGLPSGEMQNIPGGRQQVFQRASLYHKNSEGRAFEVHGSILVKYQATGATGKWGFPVSDETDIKSGSSVIGKMSEFEGCVIYWSGSTGAWEIHGDLLLEYKAMNGPMSNLGFPTSDESNTPGVGGARHNTFQKGTMVWYGSQSSIQVCYPFKVFLGRINSKENEGFTMGQNDLYVYTSLIANGHTVFSKRFPNTGDYGGHNIKDINATFDHTVTPNNANLKLVVRFEVWDDDGPTANDHLGTYTKELNIGNAWGLRDNKGVYNSGSFAKINSITWSVKSQINVSLLSEPDKWWGASNASTPILTKAQYASAFRDVDSETEWWDIGDHLHTLFYNLVVKSIANGGNCFGMTTEGIYARKNRSLFSMPLDRFNNFNDFKNEVNIKQAYQVGAGPIWWFMGQFVTGNTHDPVDVFNATRNAFNRGDHPVICVAQNWDFSGAPHCILPVAWDSSTRPWKITILDPNITGRTTTLFVDPDRNEFSYTGTSTYKGAAWSGGRFHYMPYSQLCSTPRTPLWEAIILLLSGLIIILGEDSVTQSIRDGNNVDLDAFGTDATNKLKNGQRIDDKLLSFKGFDAKIIKATTRLKTNVATDLIKKVERLQTAMNGKGMIPGEMLLRMNTSSGFQQLQPLVNSPHLMTMGDIMSDRAAATRLSALARDIKIMGNLSNRNVFKLAEDDSFIKSIDKNTASMLKDLAHGNDKTNQIIHQIAGTKKGNLSYLMKNPMSFYEIGSPINQGETNKIITTKPGTDAMLVGMESAAAKTMKLQIENRLGAGKDVVKVTIDRIPVGADQKAEFNLQQGLGSIDIVGSADRVQALVTVETNINGKLNKKSFNTSIEGGLRIHPATVLSSNELLVGKIDKVFGQLQESSRILNK